jgi:hypothetical protein
MTTFCIAFYESYLSTVSFIPSLKNPLHPSQERTL